MAVPLLGEEGAGAGGCRVLLESRRKKGARRQSLDRGATGRGGRERPVTGGVRAEVSASLAGRGDLGGRAQQAGGGGQAFPSQGVGAVPVEQRRGLQEWLSQILLQR